MNQLWTIFKRSAIYEARFLRHNRWDFTMLFWLPFFTIFLIWWIFSRAYISDLPIGVLDDSHSGLSQTLTNYLNTSPDLQVIQHYNHPQQAIDALLAQQVYGVVIIPQDFATNINSANPSPVILKVNAQYGSHSGIVQRGVQTVVGTLSAGVEIKRMVKQGTNPNQATTAYAPIIVNRIGLFNAGTNYQQFLASTVLPSLLHILAMIIGATTVGRELRDHSLGVWYKCAINPDMPYPDFKTKKHLPPAQKFKPATQHFDDVYLTPVDNDISNGVSNDVNKYASNNVNKYASNNVSNDASNDSSNRIIDNINHGSNPDTSDAVTNAKLLPLVMALNGKLIWGMLPYTLWGAVILVLAISIHSASFLSWMAVYLVFLLLMMVSLWLGAIFCLSSFSLRTGLSTTGFVSAPSYAFAGVAFPLLAMSEGSARWASILPLTPYLKVQIAQLQMLAPASFAIPYIYGFILGVAGCMLVTVLLCKRALAHPIKWGGR